MAVNSYRIQLASGTIGAGMSANSPIFSFRWASAAKTARIREVRVGAESLGTGFTAGLASFAIFRASGWSAADTGGTAITASAITKMAPGMGDSLSAIRMADTAALTPGTRTLDTHSIGLVNFSVTNATNTVFANVGQFPLFEVGPSTLEVGSDRWTPPGLYLGLNEGFVVHGTVPATGTWTARVRVVWDE